MGLQLDSGAALRGPGLAQLVGDSAALAQSSQAQGVVALGEADAGVVGHQGTVVEMRWRGFQSAVEQELAGGAHEQVGAANDFGDVHGNIVHDAGELIGRDIVVAPDDEVAEVFPGNELLRAEVGIVESDGLAIGNAKTPVEFAAGELGFLQVAASAWVNGFVVVIGVRGADSGLEVFARAGAGIHEASLFQSGDGVAVERVALALIVGCERAADVRAFLPIEAEPAEVFEHGGDELHFAAGVVDVFVAEDEDAAVGPGAFQHGPESSRVAEMEIAGWRRGNPAAVRLIFRRTHGWELTTNAKVNNGFFGNIKLFENKMSSFGIRRTYITEVGGGERRELCTNPVRIIETNRESWRLTQRMRRAFTLIELLVVITIIGILAALLVPVLSSAKARAVTTRCLSNMKQFGLSFHLYAGDNNDFIPVNLGGAGVPVGKTWVEGIETLGSPDCTNVTFLEQSLIARYITSTELWRCPACTDEVDFGGQKYGRVRTLSMNHFLGPPWTTTHAKTYRRLSEIGLPSPSDMFVFIEERTETINDATFSSHGKFDETQPATWEMVDLPAVLHKRGCNISFADGHTETHHWQDPRTVEAVHDTTPMPGSQDVLWIEQHNTFHIQ